MKAVLLICALAACDDALDQRLAIVTEPRVLAVQAEPAEAKPGAMVTYRALVASPLGPIADPRQWAYCTAPKPPTEDNAVSEQCIETTALIDLGTSSEVIGTLPSDGCIRFGPDTPPGGYRPRDPDPTGGYYQPVRVSAGDELAFGLSRITCKLPTAPFDVARDYDLHYVANANPTLEPLTIDRVPPDTDVELGAAWPAAAVESYLYYDALAQKLVDRREAMRVSWFATGGTIAVDASAVDEDGSELGVSTTWHTPATGEAWLWIVLRDSRGGVAWQEHRVVVE